MSTIIKNISMLPLLVQILIGLLTVITICVLVGLKFAIGLWVRVVQSVEQHNKSKINREQHETNPNESPTRQIQQKYKNNRWCRLMLSCTILQPCIQNNSSVNKLPFLIVLQCWLSVLTITGVGTGLNNNVNENLSIGEHFKNIQWGKICMYMGWISVIVFGIDWAVRYYSVSQLTKHIINNKDQSITQNNNVTLPKIQLGYYLIIVIFSFLMLLLTTLQILVSNVDSPILGLQVPNFYHWYQINTRMIQTFIGTLVLCILHHALAFTAASVALLAERLVQHQQCLTQEFKIKWIFMLGSSLQVQQDRRKILGTLQQSKQNLRYQTDSNNVELYLFTQQQSNIKKQANKLKLKSPKSIIQTSNPELTQSASMVSNKIANSSIYNINKSNNSLSNDLSVKKRKPILFQQKEHFNINQNKNQASIIKENINLQRHAKHRRVRASFNQQTPVHRQAYLEENQIKAAEQKIPSFFYHQENNECEPGILQNIQNKLSRPELLQITPSCHASHNRHSSSGINNSYNLKVIDYSEQDQNLDGLQVLDLSNYVLKNLGCVSPGYQRDDSISQSKANRWMSTGKSQHYQSSVTINTSEFGTENKKPLKFQLSRRKKKRDERRAPSVPELQAEGFTFSLQDNKVLHT